MDSEYPHIAFLTYAKEFADAASVIVDSGRATGMRIAISYLYGHAIELAVKSILLKNGVCLENVKKIGHDLEECVEQAGIYPEGGLIDDQLRKIAELLHPEYAGKRLEYHPGETFMVLPNEESMQNSVLSLVRSLRTRYTPARPPRGKARC